MKVVTVEKGLKEFLALYEDDDDNIVNVNRKKKKQQQQHPNY